VEARLLPEILSPRISVLKVGHHGSATSTSRELVQRIRPEIGVISVGRRNRFGHPDPEVLERLEWAGAALFRTDRDGDLRIRARENGTVLVSTEFSRR
jgi:competence protein ComEC